MSYASEYSKELRQMPLEQAAKKVNNDRNLTIKRCPWQEEPYAEFRDGSQLWLDGNRYDTKEN